MEKLAVLGLMPFSLGAATHHLVQPLLPRKAAHGVPKGTSGPESLQTSTPVLQVIEQLPYEVMGDYDLEEPRGDLRSRALSA